MKPSGPMALAEVTVLVQRFLRRSRSAIMRSDVSAYFGLQQSGGT